MGRRVGSPPRRHPARRPWRETASRGDRSHFSDPGTAHGVFMIRPDFLVSDIAGIAARVAAAGRRVVTIDGFSGCGKSALAERLSRKMQIEHIALDDFLVDDVDFIGVKTYVCRLHGSRLARALQTDSALIVEGAHVREAIARLVARKDITMLYLAVCSGRPHSSGKTNRCSKTVRPELIRTGNRRRPTAHSCAAS
jgi:hypothetical protein